MLKLVHDNEVEAFENDLNVSRDCIISIYFFINRLLYCLKST